MDCCTDFMWAEQSEPLDYTKKTLDRLEQETHRDLELEQDFENLLEEIRSLGEMTEEHFRQTQKSVEEKNEKEPVPFLSEKDLESFSTYYLEEMEKEEEKEARLNEEKALMEKNLQDFMACKNDMCYQMFCFEHKL